MLRLMVVIKYECYVSIFKVKFTETIRTFRYDRSMGRSLTSRSPIANLMIPNKSSRKFLDKDNAVHLDKDNAVHLDKWHCTSSMSRI
ncbi:hypothetical protein F2Q69_00015181 [Brassica cretica]|uniref:Uncharacterized protein n=1 Tax=Brassica cretica TaxID=69181 RepID=A0A8S9QQF0_BRACR|nr:hypothetical protein F2Q69_00015181 [Brassica cretica]